MTPLALYCTATAIINAVTSFSLGLYVITKNTRSLAHRTFFGFAMSVALWSFCYVLWQLSTDALQALIWLRSLMAIAIFIPTLFTHFVLTLFGMNTEKRPLLRLSYALNIAFLFSDLTDLFIAGVSEKSGFRFWPIPGPLFHFFLIQFGASVVYAHTILYGKLRTSSGNSRNQIRYLFLGTLLGFSGGATNFPLWYNIPIPPIGNAFVALYVAMVAYAIIRYRLMAINLAITRTTVFMLVYTAVLGIPLLAALSWQIRLEQLLGNRWWVWVLLVYAALATAAHYANLYFQQRAENRLLAEQRRYQSVLRQAAQGMTMIKDLGKLLNLIVHLLTQKVRIRHAGIYLWDPQVKKFVPSVSRQWPVKDLDSFPSDHPLIEFLHWHRVPIVTEELGLQARGGEKELQPVVNALKGLQAAVVVPSFTEKKCEGFLLLGDKVSGGLFSTDDLQVFQVLASQAALAIENAQFYEELKRTQTDLFQTAKMASLGHMAGGMSHQINNRFHVLTILAGTLKSVMKDMDPATIDKEQLKQLWDKTVETLSKLEDNALRGGDIVKTLLRFSRPAGEYKVVTVPQILSTAKEVSQFRVNMSAIDYVEEVAEGVPEVKGDLNQLADCCFNLLTNAFDAVQRKATMNQEKQISPGPDDPAPFKGKLWIRARTEKKDERAWVVLELQDNGTGMASHELENLFVPFFTTKATAQKGTGLGLYVIQRIMERHGGTISAVSKQGVGTTFTLRLPAAVQAAATGTTPVAEAHGEKSAAA